MNYLISKHSENILFFYAALVLWSACTSQEQLDNRPVFEVAKPIVTDTFYFREFVANINAVSYVEVRSRVKGYVEKMHVDEGQRVKQGQLLFSISSLEYQKELQKAFAAHKSALADLKAAEVELSQVTSLTEKSIVSKAELEMVKAKVEALKAQVDEAEATREQAELNVELAKIKAPYSGIINRIPNKVGSLIEEGSMLTTISDNSEVFAYFQLSERDYLNIKELQSAETRNVRLRLADNALYEERGIIEIIESEFDQQSGTIAVRARFPNPNGLLKHGSNGKILFKAYLPKAILVPQKSTFEIQDKIYTYVLTADSTLALRNIKPKMRLTGFYVVESGIKPDEYVVYEGVENAKDGVAIRALPLSLREKLQAEKEQAQQ